MLQHSSESLEQRMSSFALGKRGLPGRQRECTAVQGTLSTSRWITMVRTNEWGVWQDTSG